LLIPHFYFLPVPFYHEFSKSKIAAKQSVEKQSSILFVVLVYYEAGHQVSSKSSGSTRITPCSTRIEYDAVRRVRSNGLEIQPKT
jgi:hypothetical protein